MSFRSFCSHLLYANFAFYVHVMLFLWVACSIYSLNFYHHFTSSLPSNKKERKVSCFVGRMWREVNWDLKLSLENMLLNIPPVVLWISSTVASSLTRNGIWPQIIPPCIHFPLSSFHRAVLWSSQTEQKYAKPALSCSSLTESTSEFWAATETKKSKQIFNAE